MDTNVLTNNLSKKQRQAIMNLQNHPDLEIKASDKGGNVVLMTKANYEKMVFHILNNKEWYRRINDTQIALFKNEFLSIIGLAHQRGLIDQDLYNYLNIRNPRTATFYALPKIHKHPLTPPGRPIVSGIGSLTENASRFVDSILMPHVLTLPSYTRDTLDLLKQIEDMVVPRDALLVTLDVEALYSSIPHELGISTARTFLREQDHHHWNYIDFVIDLLRFILTRNHFVFKESHFLQVQGVAMGTCCAPGYANLYLGGWERDIFSDEDLSMYTGHVINWLRYIDDIFIIWSGTSSQLYQFIDILNVNERNLKFTFTASSDQVTFLDLTILKDGDGRITSSLFRKETAGNTLLHATSAHPTNLLKSIPYAQYLRLRRNCTMTKDFLLQANLLRQRLLLRGYSKSLLRKAFNKAARQSRINLLFKQKVNTESQPVRFITRYSSHHIEVRNILNKHWSLLTNDPILSNYIGQRPDITFKRSRSLRDKLTSSHYKTNSNQQRPPNGMMRCGRCNFCPWVREGTTFSLPNGEIFTPNFYADCNTQGIIYLMTCSCHAFYVGKTIRNFKHRIRDHVYYSSQGKMVTSVSRHLDLYHKFNTSVASFIVLAIVPKDCRGGNWDKQVLQKETYWIERLDALRPPGINEAQSYKSFL
ncbi:uncharacterized protein LOC120943646 [Rana temporaria]|nr:uncharacterized protein LOC120943646 [Rana temporaria]XP_040212986.1 uncharacterized protein LOC120943646 [Rana temporaria]XP_040212987.1 uncharacterized protein LOC120943646 [Rana temporaria]